MNFLYIVRSIFALLIIIWLANVLLKKVSQYMQNQAKSIEIIERVAITKTSSLAIVKIVNRYYLMSFSEKNNEMLSEFTAEEVVEILDTMQEDPTESSLLDISKLKDDYATFFKKDGRK